MLIEKPRTIKNGNEINLIEISARDYIERKMSAIS